MAVAFVRTHTAVSIKTAGTNNLGVNIDTATTVGNTLIAYIIFDNAATASKPAVSSIAKAAGETASWVFLGAARHAFAATAGVYGVAEIWAIRTTVIWPVASYLVTLDTSVTMKATRVQEFSGVLAALRSSAGVGGGITTGGGTSNNTTFGTVPLAGDLVLGLMVASNSVTGPAADTDTTGGAWSAVSGFGSTGGSAATNNTASIQYKILTANGHQTLNSSVAPSTDNTSVVVSLQQYVATSTGKAKVWTGSVWVEKPVKYWNGSAWVEKPAKYWNGSTWVLA